MKSFLFKPFARCTASPSQTQRFVYDYPNSTPIDVKLILESLEMKKPPCIRTKQLLYQSVAEDYKDIASARARYMNIRNDPLNAIQVKFAYALTCHKTQGGNGKLFY